MIHVHMYMYVLQWSMCISCFVYIYLYAVITVADLVQVNCSRMNQFFEMVLHVQ